MVGVAEALSALTEAAEPYVQKSRQCATPGCYELTRENKPFCLNHIEQTPYVHQLLIRMENREKIDEGVSSDHRKATLDSITAQEILLSLRQKGTVTEDSLCRTMNLGRQTVHNYVLSMLDKKLVMLRVTQRGRTNVTLLDVTTGQPAAPVPMDDEDDDE